MLFGFGGKRKLYQKIAPIKADSVGFETSETSGLGFRHWFYNTRQGFVITRVLSMLNLYRKPKD
jgi:hypothetical protein